MRAFLAALILCACAIVPAQATHRHQYNTHQARIHVHRVAGARHHVHWSLRVTPRRHVAQGDIRHAQKFQPWAWSAQEPKRVAAPDGSARPRDCYGIAWCGCYLRHLLGVADRALNLAANWTRWGRASAPRAGAVVVWPHHVGIIRGGPDMHGRWLVESGNDGHAVRIRYRSIAGAIAFRE
jgi:hypothetical protein